MFWIPVRGNFRKNANNNHKDKLLWHQITIRLRSYCSFCLTNKMTKEILPLRWLTLSWHQASPGQILKERHIDFFFQIILKLSYNFNTLAKPSKIKSYHSLCWRCPWQTCPGQHMKEAQPLYLWTELTYCGTIILIFNKRSSFLLAFSQVVTVGSCTCVCSWCEWKLHMNIIGRRCFHILSHRSVKYCQSLEDIFSIIIYSF